MIFFLTSEIPEISPEGLLGAWRIRPKTPTTERKTQRDENDEGMFSDSEDRGGASNWDSPRRKGADAEMH